MFMINSFAKSLIHCQSRSQHARTRIWDLEPIKQALNRPVFTAFAMQSIENDVDTSGFGVFDKSHQLGFRIV